MKSAARSTELVLGAAVVAAFVACAFIPTLALAQGCAMCATAVAPNEARGMNISILFLMSMPFLLTGSVGGWLWYSFWQSRRKQAPLGMLHASREEAS
jgi:hypothetical protein